MNKSNIIREIILILIIILLFSLPITIDMLPKTHFTYVSGLILCSIVLIFIMFNTYKDIRDKKYTTNTFIILTDMIIILAMASFLLIEYKTYSLVDMVDISYFNNIRNIVNFVFYTGLFFNEFLRGNKFIKPI